jgi:hypothetical protein
MSVSEAARNVVHRSRFCAAIDFEVHWKGGIRDEAVVPAVFVISKCPSGKEWIKSHAIL